MGIIPVLRVARVVHFVKSKRVVVIKSALLVVGGRSKRVVGRR